MTDEKIIEALAVIEGVNDLVQDRIIGDWHSRSDDASIPNLKSYDYPNSHDAAHRIIDAMDEDQICGYLSGLVEEMIPQNGEGENFCDSAVIYYALKKFQKATPRQKCIAILRAYGKWDGE